MVKTLVLSGANGFIGNHLRRRLKKKGIRVEAVADVLKPFNPAFKPQAVIHLAAVSLPEKFRENPSASLKVNIEGTLNLLDLAKKSGASFIFASTSAVYGVPDRIKVKEKDPIRLQTTYARSKWIGEILCEEFAQNHGVPATVLRLFNVYGPGQQPQFLIPTIVNNALAGHSTGLRHPDHRRDFLHVDDLIDLIELVLARPPQGLQRFNVGCGSLIRVQGVIKVVGRCLKKPVAWHSIKSEAAETRAVCADISLVKRSYSWRPKVSFAKGISTIIQDLADKAPAAKPVASIS